MKRLPRAMSEELITLIADELRTLGMVEWVTARPNKGLPSCAAFEIGMRDENDQPFILSVAVRAFTYGPSDYPDYDLRR